MRVRVFFATVLASLVGLPFTAPFATYDLKGHQLDLRTPQAELLAAKTTPEEDVAMCGAAPVAPHLAPVFLGMAESGTPDEASKHQIPSRILRL
ncbi:MAG: hypothetical protein ABUS56_04045 [Acidobacteriota bacterium]